MKRSQLIALLALVLAGTLAAAQSLGEYARTARKNKRGGVTASHHYDNDNMPTSDQLNIVGPAPQQVEEKAPATAATGTDTQKGDKADKTDKAKAAQDMRDKLEKQKEKVADLNHQLDLEQRENKLKSAAYYSDAGTRLRNAAQFDKQQAEYRSDVESKQKAIDTARQELDQMREDARKAGVQEKDDDRGNK